MCNNKFISILVALFSLVWLTGAGWLPLAGVVAPTFQGPGDVVSGAIMWWGLRSYNLARAGNPAISLCDHTGANCADVSTDVVTGNLNSPGTRGADNCNVLTTCIVAAVYDQSGSNSCTGVAPCTFNSGTQPTFKLNCSGSGKPCLQCSGSQFLRSTLTPTGAGAQPFTNVAFVTRTGAFTTTGSWFGNDGDAIRIGFNNATNTVISFAALNGPTATASDNSQHSIQAFVSGASSFFTIDGVDGSTGNTGTNALGTSVLRLCIDGNGNFMTGNFFEQGIWAATFTGTQRTNISNNATSYW